MLQLWAEWISPLTKAAVQAVFQWVDEEGGVTLCRACGLVSLLALLFVRASVAGWRDGWPGWVAGWLAWVTSCLVTSVLFVLVVEWGGIGSPPHWLSDSTVHAGESHRAGTSGERTQGAAAVAAAVAAVLAGRLLVAFKRTGRVESAEEPPPLASKQCADEQPKASGSIGEGEAENITTTSTQDRQSVANRSVTLPTRADQVSRSAATGHLLGARSSTQ